MKQVPALDGLRALAIVAVFFLHANMLLAHPWPMFTVGWVGVDLFFVLSGYLITTILLETRGGAGYFRVFYVRRALRILPLYYGACAVLFVGLEHTHFGGTVGYEHLRAEGAWFWCYGVNWLFALKGWDAVPLGTAHFWSLAVEEQFYLMWPLVVLAAGRRGMARVALGALVVSVVLRLTLVLRHVDTTSIYVATPTHWDGLVIGAWLAADGLRYARRVISIGLLAIVGYAVFALMRRTANVFDPAIAVVAVTLVSLGAAALVVYALRDAPRWLAWRPLVGVGRISYGLYVIHFPVLAALEIRWPHGGWLAVVLAGAITGVAAVLSWVCVERPILSLKRYLPYGGQRAVGVHGSIV